MAKDVAYLAAEKKIEEALKLSTTVLDLSNDYRTPDEKKLTKLPESIGKLKRLTSLNLSYNQLTALPDSIGQLTQLQTLYLSNNQLTALPDSIGQLTQLQTLYLSNNQLTTLPDSLGQLTQLQTLDISINQLTALPEAVGNLRNLTGLHLYSNRLVIFPEVIGNLTNLTILRLGGTQLTTVSKVIGKLSNLTELHLHNNELTTLPEVIGKLSNLTGFLLAHNQLTNLSSSFAQLEHLESFNLDENPLNPALQSAYDACKPPNYEPLKAYLRSLENAEPLYEAKLVLVGEGNVGKTTLLKALKSKKGEGAPKKDERTTHGVEIDIHGLKLPHPEKDGVEIQLNAWDFGGQDVYRVTHQFFFSRRSLYLLVWEPRRGVQAGQVEDWLNMIRLRVGDEARVLIVSTHCKTGERIARIDKPVLQQQYGEMIVGFYEVDSLVPDEHTGEMVGIAALKKVIAEESAKLEQMGMLFNNNWKAARDELLTLSEPRISYAAFGEVCDRHSLSQIDTSTLAHLMHDLGYIVHYSDDERLRDDVVLQPQWLTKAIGFVLEDRTTQECEGILPDGRLSQVWHDHPFEKEPRYDPTLYPFFLRLMEKYDVSYRLPDGKASLVAQHVPQVRPELPWLPEQDPPEALRRIAMICAMEEDPPGLVPWMIVRTHDYSTELTNATGSIHRLHWQKGMFLNHGAHGQAMLEKRDREFHVYTQADWPEYFMNVIQHTLQKLITDNWPGMEGRYRFMVPCPEMIGGQPCKGRFPIHTLRQWLAEGDTTARCQDCSKRQSIAELLFGFEERPVDVQLREIKEQLAGLDSRIANYFMAMMHAIADEAKDGPRLFTFRSREAGLSPQQLLGRPLNLQLWCEAEGCQHPIIEDGKGLYPIDQPHDWVVKIAPYANFALKVLATVAPIAGPAINTVFGPKTTEAWKIADQLSLAGAIIGKLPAKLETPDRNLAPGKMLSEPERSGILALHRFLNEKDPTQDRLGLQRVPTYTGDYRWLCKYHYDAWQPNIPDVIA
ncbi:MAG: leucine-rich repeat domain-containing protein [Anaerolineae bacterium]|nr:leucine-rich repeat domain-containing protein [Anaerolineae bacterium]